ncbi:MAG: phage tail protein [Solirubrobacteraceae bacterium]
MTREEILELLPDVFRRTATGAGDPLTALIDVMAALHAPDEAVLANLDAYLDPRRCPDAFVAYLSRWVDLAWTFLDPPDDPYAEPGRPFAGGAGVLGELVACAARESRWQGTAGGLVRMLEAATGVTGFEVDEAVRDDDGAVRPFFIRVHGPAAARALEALVLRIAAHEKPAHVILDPEIAWA